MRSSSSSPPPTTPPPDPAAAPDATRSGTTSSPLIDDATPQVASTYELMHVPPARYLCAVPVLAARAAPNQTATALAKAEEARERQRAVQRGWQLVGEMDGECLYYVAGWWSYSFCYGREVTQFHAVPPGQMAQHQPQGLGPPVRDPNSQEYVLGRAVRGEVHRGARDGSGVRAGRGRRKAAEVDLDAAAAEAETGKNGVAPPPNTELQVKDDQRYLVQRLEGGTLCDLTGRDRTIEIQYHCAPGTNMDRVNWIKEVTTCAYVMVVNTPRLCNDVAFLPPIEPRAHPISCQLVVDSDAEADTLKTQQTIEGADAADGAEVAQDGAAGRSPWQQQRNHFTGMTIGGVVVGGRQVLGSTEDGQPAARLPPPRQLSASRLAGLFGANAAVEMLAVAKSLAEGGKYEAMTDEELKNMGLNPEAIEKLRQELQKLAGDKGWKLEVVETAGGMPEIRGVIESEAEGGDGGDADDGRPLRQGDKEAGSGEGEGEDGSEEHFFKEEL